MPVSRPIAFACLAAAFAASSPASAQPALSNAAPLAHRAVRPKQHSTPPVADNAFMHVDDWFSYGQREADVERAAPGVQIKAHDPHEDDIIVYGARQRREFEGATRDPNLTAPQGLDAAQPVVPGIGDSCSYKGGCYDMGQTPLRSAASSLFGGD
jgi:hypothetical protein